jgi:hypothetical protein
VRLRALADRCRRSADGRRHEDDDRTASRRKAGFSAIASALSLLVGSTLENTTSAAKIEPGLSMAIKKSLPCAVRRAMQQHIMRTALDGVPGHFIPGDDPP